MSTTRSFFYLKQNMLISEISVITIIKFKEANKNPLRPWGLWKHAKQPALFRKIYIILIDLETYENLLDNFFTEKKLHFVHVIQWTVINDGYGLSAIILNVEE